MITSISKSSALLGLTAFIATSFVTLTYTLTKDTIAEQQKLHVLKELNQIIPSSLHDNPLYESCTLVSNENLGTLTPMPVFIATKKGKTTALAAQIIAPDGYGGAIKLLLGIDNAQKVLGVRVLTHNETPGLGDKIELRISDWINSFTNKIIETQNDYRWAIRKEGGDFDQFTGATITPRAVVNASKKAAWYLSQNIAQIALQPHNCEVK